MAMGEDSELAPVNFNPYRTVDCRFIPGPEQQQRPTLYVAGRSSWLTPSVEIDDRAEQSREICLVGGR